VVILHGLGVLIYPGALLAQWAVPNWFTPEPSPVLPALRLGEMFAMLAGLTCHLLAQAPTLTYLARLEDSLGDAELARTGRHFRFFWVPAVAAAVGCAGLVLLGHEWAMIALGIAGPVLLIGVFAYVTRLDHFRRAVQRVYWEERWGHRETHA
jgi:hypothetical protein